MSRSELSRISIIGCSGSGKSTLARELGSQLSLPVVHLDVLYWKPGWTESESDEFLKKVNESHSSAEWVSDGTFHETWDIRLLQADLILWLRLPRRICLFRAIKRWIKHKTGVLRPDLAPGCEEQIDFEFYRYMWNYEKIVVPRIEAYLGRHNLHSKTEVFTSDTEVKNWLKSIA